MLCGGLPSKTDWVSTTPKSYNKYFLLSRVMLSVTPPREDVDMLYSDHPATILSSSGPQQLLINQLLSSNHHRMLYVVELNVYDYDWQTYTTCIKIGQTTRSLQIRLKEFGREYKCRWIKPLMLYHSNVDDHHWHRLYKANIVYGRNKYPLRKSTGGLTHEFFKNTSEIKQFITLTLKMGSLKDQVKLLWNAT